MFFVILTPSTTSANDQFTYDSVKAKIAQKEQLTASEQTYWNKIHPVQHQGLRRELPRRDDRGGPDDFGYQWIDSDEEGGPEFDWIDITEVGRAVQLSDDDSQGPFQIGFEFPFYGDNIEEFNICSNGYITFGNEFMDYEHGIYQFPSEEEPFNIIAPLWLDLNPDEGGTIFYWANEDENMLVVEWFNVPTYDWEDIYDEFGPKTFQVILYANGAIVFQYLDDNGPHEQGLIGMQNSDGSSGFQIANNEEWEHPELAVRIRDAAGWVFGQVTDLATEDPIEGASVTFSDGTNVETDEEGIYWANEIGEGDYTVTVSALGYNTVESDEFEVPDQDTVEVNVALPHPEIRVDPEEFIVELPQQGVDNRVLTITNEGNGTLEFWSEFTIPVRRDDPGDVIFEWDASGMTEDNRLKGITSLGNEIFVSGANNSDNPNMIYVFNLEGDLTRTFEQPVEEPSSNGMRGLTSDGEFLYGADGREIYQITTDGEFVRNFPAPVNPTTNLAFDPESGHIWASGTTNDIVEIDLEGNVISEVDDGHRKYGIAWHPADPDGFNLYVFHHERNVSDALITKANVETGEFIDVIDLTSEEGDEGVDLFITDMFNPLVWMYVTLMEEGVPDVIRGIELDLNTSWIEIDPMQGSVDPDSELEVSYRFDAGNWMPGVYELVQVIESNAAGDDVLIPLTLIVTDEGIEMQFFDFDETERRHTFVINSLSLLGEAAVFGDEIGVFTPDGMCVGGSVWFDQVTTVPAYGDDPDTDFTEGFFVDDPYAFRVWDEDGEREYAANFELIAGDERFAVDGNTRGILDVPDLGRVLQFDLSFGWSLISLNIILEEDDVVAMFAPLVERGTLALLKDGQGRFYSPQFNFNNIPFWNELEGYQIKLDEEDAIEFAGDAIDPATVLNLRDGWSMISYLPQWEMDAPTTFEPLGEDLLIAKDGDGRFYVPAFGFTNMGDLSELNGYQVKLEEAQEFVYPQANMLAAVEPAAESELQYFGLPVRTDENMSLLIFADENEHMEIGVFDSQGDLCGSGVLNAEGIGGVAVWGDDNSSPGKDGFLVNEELTIVSWGESSGANAVEYRIISGSDQYAPDAFTALEIISQKTSLPSEFGIIGVYPNPFNDQTVVSFGVPDQMRLTASLYNIQGQKVSDILNRLFAPGNYSLTLKADELPTGTYILRLQSETLSSNLKVILMR